MSTYQTDSIRVLTYMVAALVWGAGAVAIAQTADAKKSSVEHPPTIEGAQVHVYKTIGDVALNAYVFLPQGHRKSDNRPAIVFFFGGGWKSGTPTQFEHHCRYLAARGLVAITADYRVAKRHAVKPVSCVADAKSAIRWTRSNASDLGIDPNRIIAGGGSAGGHIAACTGTLDKYDEASEDRSISSIPNAMALFNPVLVLAPVGDKPPFDKKRLSDISARLGVEPEMLSPYHHVGADMPPTIVFHGKADTTVGYKTAELFTDAMIKHGNRCELIGYEGQSHGFFNYGRGDENHFKQTLLELDEFLISLDYLNSTPTAADLTLLEK